MFTALSMARIKFALSLQSPYDLANTSAACENFPCLRTTDLIESKCSGCSHKRSIARILSNSFWHLRSGPRFFSYCIVRFDCDRAAAQPEETSAQLENVLKFAIVSPGGKYRWLRGG